MSPVTIGNGSSAAHDACCDGESTNTGRFRATNIPDMAFNLSDHCIWDGTSVVVDDATRRRASAQAAYNATAADYHQVARYARHALEWLSHNWPVIGARNLDGRGYDKR